MSIVVDVVNNPSNTEQGYILWANGYLQPFGGALPVAQEEFGYDPFTGGGWSVYNHKAPTFYGTGWEIARRVQILDWTIPRGYTLDGWGHVYPWGGAADVPGATAPFTNGPEYFFGTNGGFPAWPYGYITDFQMDPSNGGTGYLLKLNGDVAAIGTGVTAVAHVGFLNHDQNPAHAMAFDWTSKRYWILASHTSTLYGANGGSNATLNVPTGGGVNIFGGGSLWDLKLYDFTAGAPKGWAIESFGTVFHVGSTQPAPGYPYDPNFDGWRGLIVIDSGLSTTPLRIAVVSLDGSVNRYTVSTPPSVAVLTPVKASTVTTTTRPVISWQYGDPEGDGPTLFEVAVISTSVFGSGTNETQRLTVTGTPTGGTFQLGFRGEITAPIAYNASAATIDAALELLGSIGTGGVSCTGGPLPGTAVDVQFTAHLGKADQPPITVVNPAFTGGSSPVLTVTTPTPGTGIDPATATAVYRTSFADPQARSVQPPADLANDTYRVYVRATDTSGQVSLWNFAEWVQSVTRPATPTITPTVNSGIAGISLLIHVAGVTAGWKFAVQYHDADWDGSTWEFVRDSTTGLGGFDLVPNGSGDYTIVDKEARFGVARSYRAITYTYDPVADVWNAGAWSSTVTPTALGPRNVWVLSDPFNATNDLVLPVVDFAPEWESVAGVFRAVNRRDPIVVTDGTPTLPTFPLHAWLKTNADRVKVEAMLLNSTHVLLLRDVFGRAFYFRPVGRIHLPVVRAQALASEVTGIRDMHELTADVQTVARPSAAPVLGPLAD